MNDHKFQQVLDRVKRNKSETTGRRYASKAEDFSERLDGKAFEEADAIDVEDWLAELDEKYSNSSSVGKASRRVDYLVAVLDGVAGIGVV